MIPIFSLMKPRDPKKLKALGDFVAARVREYVTFKPDGTMLIDLRNY
jgi:hypothetical protein